MPHLARKIPPTVHLQLIMKTVFCLLAVFVALCAARTCKEHQDEVNALLEEVPLLGVPVPRCDENDNYAAVQCVGSMCYCANKDGEAIAASVAIPQAIDMNCSCARDRHEYMSSGMIGKMFMCDDLGNYAAKQCVGDVCFCGDESGEMLGSSESVHISDLDSLEC